VEVRASRPSAQVISSTPGAADVFKPKKLARRTSMVRCWLLRTRRERTRDRRVAEQRDELAAV
jgi:hypothetical protein